MNEIELIKLFRRVQHLHSKYAMNEFSKSGITPGQPRILDFLVSNDGCIQKDMSDSFDIEPSTITNSLGVMEKSGLIRREMEQCDRRNLRVYITDKGREAHNVSEMALKKLAGALFEGFSEQEKEQFYGFLQKINSNQNMN